MLTNTSTLPLLACFVSLWGALGIVLLRTRPNLRESITLIAGVVKFALMCSMIPWVIQGNVYEFVLVELLPGIPILFRVDSFGLLFGLVASFLWILTSIYGIGYMRGLKEHSQTRFFTFFAVSMTATVGVAFAGNLLTLYLFYELLSMATYPLVTHHGDKEARSGGRTYLTYLLTTSIGFVLPAMAYCYLKSDGDILFTQGANFAGALGGGEITVLLLLFVFGFAKAGVMPFHSWLPNAMVAPTPVSALLHAVAVVKVGVFCIVRVFTGVFSVDLLETLGNPEFVTYIAGFTIVVSSLIALTQDNLKRRLAFSTIGQLSYIILGVSFLSANGVTGSGLHIATHAFGKITLFFCAGAIYVASGKKYISQMVGLGRRMPFTMTAFLIGSLSIIGLPPFFGAWSKWYLILGAFDTQNYVIVGILILSTLLNIAYLIPISVNALFRKPSEEQEKAFEEQGIGEAPLACVIPLCLTATLCFVLFCFPDVAYRLAHWIAG